MFRLSYFSVSISIFIALAKEKRRGRQLPTMALKHVCDVVVSNLNRNARRKKLLQGNNNFLDGSFLFVQQCMCIPPWLRENTSLSPIFYFFNWPETKFKTAWRTSIRRTRVHEVICAHTPLSLSFVRPAVQRAAYQFSYSIPPINFYKSWPHRL